MTFGDAGNAALKSAASKEPAPARAHHRFETITASLALALFAALSLAGCGPRITNANIEVVNRQLENAEKLGRGGVSPKEVESILGPPQHTETKTVPLETQKKEVELVRYYYKQGDQVIEMHFLDNKLISRVPHLEPATPPLKSTP